MRKKHLLNRLFNVKVLIPIIILYILVKYPPAYKKIIIEESDRYNLDPYLVASIINVESRYDKDARSKKGAKGLMQIMDETGEWIFKELGIEANPDALYQPSLNVKAGCWYLSFLFKKFNGDLNLILAAYNAGPGNVEKWIEESGLESGEKLEIPFKETRDYIDKVKSQINAYSKLYKGSYNLDKLDFYKPMEWIHIGKRKIKR